MVWSVTVDEATDNLGISEGSAVVVEVSYA